MTFARALIFIGLALAAIGVLLQFAPALRLGRLPGDFSFGGSGWRVYIPVGTSILLSIIVTLVLLLIGSLGARK